MPDLWPFIVSGLAFGGLYALSGVGLVLLYRTTAVVNFAYGAVGALAALAEWQIAQNGGGEITGIVVGIAGATVVSTIYGTTINPRLARRSHDIASAGSLGAAVIILGICTLIWSDRTVRTLTLSTSNVSFSVGTTVVNLTQVVALAMAVIVVLAASLFLRRTLTGTAMRALAEDRELTAVLGVRVRRVETMTWAIVGALAGVTGILLANLLSLQAELLTFLVISSLAAAVIGRFQSLWMALAGGIVIGLLQSIVVAFPSISAFSDATPFVVAIVALLLLDVSRPTRVRRA
jgi:branched-chain amino acid transport system permease protein